MKNKLLRVKPDEPVMKGRLVKVNRYGMHQDRDFILYLNGEIKYFKGEKQMGTMKLKAVKA